VSTDRALDRRVAAFAASASLALAGCQATSDVFKLDSAPSAQPGAYGAVFIPRNGSVAGGNVRIVPRDDGIALTVYVTGIPPGQFRIVFHANGNCSSPNAFSAGPPWSPPGVDAARLPMLASSSDGTALLSVRVRGYKLDGPDGLLGKAVVLHEATSPLDAQPGVPNGRLACGVIGPLRTFSL